MDFREICADEKLCLYHTGRAGARDTPIDRWESMRRFAAEAIHKDGSIIDIGCGTGFFLRCLQEWSGRKLEMYGIDCDESLGEDACSLLDGVAIFDVTAEVGKLGLLLSSNHLPARYDFVYWCVWDNVLSLSDSKYSENLSLLRALLNLVKTDGRLVLAFYDSYKGADLTIDSLSDEGFVFSGKVKNSSYPGANEIVAWIEK